MNVPEDCKHKDSFTKREEKEGYECEVILRGGTIVEHDGCVTNGGCDLIAYDNNRFFLIEIKGGKISSERAKEIVEQIENCESYYNIFVGHRRKIRLFLWYKKDKKERKRIDNFAREKLKRNKIRIEVCQGSFDLTNYD
ncbi:hypothetical protein [Archaeoglobus sp.]